MSFQQTVNKHLSLLSHGEEHSTGSLLCYDCNFIVFLQKLRKVVPGIKYFFQRKHKNANRIELTISGKSEKKHTVQNRIYNTISAFPIWKVAWENTADDTLEYIHKPMNVHLKSVCEYQEVIEVTVTHLTQWTVKPEHIRTYVFSLLNLFMYWIEYLLGS